MIVLMQLHSNSRITAKRLLRRETTIAHAASHYLPASVRARLWPDWWPPDWWPPGGNYLTLSLRLRRIVSHDFELMVGNLTNISLMINFRLDVSMMLFWWLILDWISRWCCVDDEKLPWKKLYWFWWVVLRASRAPLICNPWGIMDKHFLKFICQDVISIFRPIYAQDNWCKQNCILSFNSAYNCWQR